MGKARRKGNGHGMETTGLDALSEASERHEIIDGALRVQPDDFVVRRIGSPDAPSPFHLRADCDLESLA